MLNDPLKLQLMEPFSVEPRTTKQVADLMALKAPRLYRHVEALVEADLLVFIREQPKRGIVERDYQTIAELENDISPIVMRLTGRVSPKEFAALRHKLIEWLEECELKSEEEGQIPLRGLITFFPLKAVYTK